MKCVHVCYGVGSHEFVQVRADHPGEAIAVICASFVDDSLEVAIPGPCTSRLSGGCLIPCGQAGAMPTPGRVATIMM